MSLWLRAILQHRRLATRIQDDHVHVAVVVQVLERGAAAALNYLQTVAAALAD